MLLGGKLGMGMSKHFVELKTTPPKRGRNMFTSEKLQTEFKHDGVGMKWLLLLLLLLNLVLNIIVS